MQSWESLLSIALYSLSVILTNVRKPYVKYECSVLVFISINLALLFGHIFSLSAQNSVAFFTAAVKNRKQWWVDTLVFVLWWLLYTRQQGLWYTVDTSSNFSLPPLAGFWQEALAGHNYFWQVCLFHILVAWQGGGLSRRCHGQRFVYPQWWQWNRDPLQRNGLKNYPLALKQPHFFQSL